MLKCIKQEGHFGEEEKVFEKQKAKIQTKTKLLAVVQRHGTLLLPRSSLDLLWHEPGGNCKFLFKPPSMQGLAPRETFLEQVCCLRFYLFVSKMKAKNSELDKDHMRVDACGEITC